jgi:hypothetical protein
MMEFVGVEITHAISLVKEGGLLTRDYLESLKINISTWAGLAARCPITNFLCQLLSAVIIIIIIIIIYNLAQY